MLIVRRILACLFVASGVLLLLGSLAGDAVLENLLIGPLLLLVGYGLWEGVAKDIFAGLGGIGLYATLRGNGGGVLFWGIIVLVITLIVRWSYVHLWYLGRRRRRLVGRERRAIARLLQASRSVDEVEARIHVVRVARRAKQLEKNGRDRSRW